MKKAYTLLELLLVLGILSICMMIAIPNIGFIQNWKRKSNFDQTINLMLEDMRVCKTEARNNYMVMMKVMEHGYEIRGNIDGIGNKLVEFPKDITLDKGNTKGLINGIIRYNSNGVISPPCTIGLVDSEGNRGQISIKVGTFSIGMKK